MSTANWTPLCLAFLRNHEVGSTGPELDKLQAIDKQNCLAQGGY